MRAHCVQQLVFGVPPGTPLVGEHHGSASDAEEAVGDEHGALLAKIPVLSDVLRAHHQRCAVRVHLQLLLGKANGNDASRAAHAAQVVAVDVGPHLEVVDDHGTQAGRRVEERAVHHQDVNLRRAQLGLLQHITNGGKDDHFCLLSRRPHVDVRRPAPNPRGQVGFVAEARLLHDALLKLHRLLAKYPRGPAQPHEHLLC
mmetsp:Transcript_11281/g.33912  ORF Transcript_11281/g.33912 Transcript_11281/m.33912 type:complete len:200 (-) Transcript_11281:545-1144(-)